MKKGPNTFHVNHCKHCNGPSTYKIINKKPVNQVKKPGLYYVKAVCSNTGKMVKTVRKMDGTYI